MNTAKRRVARTCRAEVIADAPVDSVWRVIADVTRTGEWSHEVGGSLGGMGAEEHLAARGEPGDPAALAGRLFRDMTGALELLTMYLGERLGLYQALDADGPATSAELAARTGTVERYVREWLEHHAASGLLVEDEFTAPASIEEQYHYGWSVVACLPAAMGDPDTTATGAVMRPATLRRYARQAGFRDLEVLPVDAGMLRFYRLTP